MKRIPIVLAGFVGLSFVFGSLSLRFEDYRNRQTMTQQQQAIQDALARTARINETVKHRLAGVLALVPSAARVRVTTLRMQDNGQLSFSNPFNAANPGHTASSYPTDSPISIWYSFLPRLLAGQCVFQEIGELAPSARDKVLDQTVAFLACPMMDGSHLVGAVFLNWDEREQIPSASVTSDICAVVQRLAINITGDILAPK